jgi:hypothetical protein
VAVACAGLLLLAAVALFVTVLGDPRAGAPSVRASLKREAPVAAPTPTGLEAFSMSAYGSWEDLAADAGAAGPAMTGEAVITLPNGATVAGDGAPVTAPRFAAQPLPSPDSASRAPTGRCRASPPTAACRLKPTRAPSARTGGRAWP